MISMTHEGHVGEAEIAIERPVWKVIFGDILVVFSLLLYSREGSSWLYHSQQGNL